MLYRLLLVSVALVLLATARPSTAATGRPGPLSGNWRGSIGGQGVASARILITINARQTAGTWRISSRCQGSLTLDSISNGYHHYLRHRGKGSTCRGGDIDCLKRVGVSVYDAVTSHRGGEYDVTGTLRRVRG